MDRNLENCPVPLLIAGAIVQLVERQAINSTVSGSNYSNGHSLYFRRIEKTNGYALNGYSLYSRA
nr:MAG TPA: hypothetical protein [Caudoviricetes sp.]